MSLFIKSAQGAFWLGLLRVTIKSFSLLKLVIVARILSPEDFGLFAMITIPYGLLEVATETGINQALIQSRKKISQYFSSAWFAFAIRGLLISICLFLLAPFISQLFNQDLNQAIKIIALAPLIKGFINPQIVLFKKHLNFKKQYYFQATTSIIESLATIYFAVKLQSMLALPLGLVTGAIVSVLLSLIISPITLGKISFKKIKNLYKYGRWVTLGTLVSYLNDQGDDFIVGKVLGSQMLGFYQNAYKISNLPTTQGASLVYQVVFPIFSTIQTSFDRLKRGVLKSLAVTFLISLSFGIIIYLTAPVLIKLFLGPKWLPMIPALNVLILFGVLRPLVSVGGAFFDAIGKPKISSMQATIKFIIMISLVYPLTVKWGIIGTAWSVVAGQLAITPIFSYQLFKTIKSYDNRSN